MGKAEAIGQSYRVDAGVSREECVRAKLGPTLVHAEQLLDVSKDSRVILDARTACSPA